MDKDQAREYIAANTELTVDELLNGSLDELWQLQRTLDVIYDRLVAADVPAITATSAVMGIVTSRLVYRALGGQDD